MSEFHHIGIVVSDIEQGKIHLANLTNSVTVKETIVDENIGVKVTFMKDKKGMLYELIAPHGDHSPVQGALSTNKNILNHVAYVSDQFDLECLRLRQQGCVPLGIAKRAKAFQQARVMFFLTPLGLIFELIEGPL